MKMPEPNQKEKLRLDLLMNMIPQAWIRKTTQNNPNLTTLFLPNGVLRAKPNLNLPLILSRSPLKKFQEKALNRKRRPTAKTREQGGGATAGRRGWRQAVGQPSPALCYSYSTLTARRAVWLGPSRKVSSPPFVLLYTLLFGTYLILLITYKSKENK